MSRRDVARGVSPFENLLPLAALDRLCDDGDAFSDLACPKFLKQTFHEFADQSIRFSGWARAYYDQQRGRGNDHHAALRALAYKWMRILFRCWKERRPYDEATSIDALRRRGSPLAKPFA